MIADPVFIVGTERSGSNLLRLLLNEMPDIAVPHPPHLMRDLSKLEHTYGDLRNDVNFRRLIGDAVRLVELHFAPWPVGLDVDQVVRNSPKRDLYSVYAAIYELFRMHSGAARWGCKSTFMIHHVRDVLDHHERPQFIHLVRDVRDVAVSARKSVFCHYHPYFVAKLWKREQELAITWSQRLAADTWLTLRYEDLIRDPQHEMRRVCGFLGSRYSDDLLKFFEKPAARELSALSRSWQNVSRPVLQNNSGKFHAELSQSAIRIIESVAQNAMEQFGYVLLSKLEELDGLPNLVTRTHYLFEEEWMMLKEESRALFLDKNARFRLKRKAYLWWLNWRWRGLTSAAEVSRKSLSGHCP
jgi:Sulfotransferase family